MLLIQLYRFSNYNKLLQTNIHYINTPGSVINPKPILAKKPQ